MTAPSYTNDVAFFCAGKKSVVAVLCLTDFCRAVDAAVNKAKCRDFWVSICKVPVYTVTLGIWATMPAEYAGISRTRTTANYLGVPLHCYENSARYW